MFFQKVLDAAHGGGSYGDPASGRRSAKPRLRFRRHFVALTMNCVFLHRGGGDGLEGAKAHMQDDIAGVDIGLVQGGEKFRGEMQSRGRGGDRHLLIMTGVDGLVALDVGGAGVALGIAPFDVRRQGHRAQPVCGGDD